MNIAVYGWVSKDAGSVASANYVLLEALLKEGHEVRLFAKRHHVDVPGLRVYKNFTQQSAGAGAPLFVLQPILSRSYLLETLYNRLRDPANVFLVSDAIRKQHALHPFDVMLFLGMSNTFSVPSLPTISWPQGPPGVEAEAFLGVRQIVHQYEHPLRYYSLYAYHLLRQLQARRSPRLPAEVISQSRWGADFYKRYGFPAHSTHVVPYPVDGEVFKPADETPTVDQPEFLHVGRLDPRKRLDLLLAAFKLVCAVEPSARLTIVGRIGYAPGVRSLLDHLPQRAVYCPAIPRNEVIRLLQGPGVLVQTSQNETFGTAVAEALSCGMTTVVGPSNGTSQYLDDFSIVFRNYDPESIALAMLLAWRRRREDPCAAVAAARHAAVLHFAPTVVANKLGCVLSSLAGAA